MENMDKEVFSVSLGIEDPLYIDGVIFDTAAGELHISVDFRAGGHFACSECGATDLPVHDTTEKTWRHLNFFQYKCYIHMRSPRTKCPKCGERLWIPPWTRKHSGFTAMFEAFVMMLAKEMPVSCIGDLVGEHDTRIWRILRGHVKRAYKKESFKSVKSIGCDETSTRRGHKYITVFADMDNGKVLFATEGRDSAAIGAFSKELKKHKARPKQIKEIAMDMSPAFISGVAEYFPKAGVTYDKFHVIQHLNKAQDEVRREESRTNPLLKDTRYIWLKNPENLTLRQEGLLEKTLRFKNMKTAKVYRMKLTFQDIYRTVRDPKTAAKAINKWLSWAVRSRLEPVKEFARFVKNHYDGIIRYFETRLTSGVMESINSRIQEIKRRAKGFQNINNFITMIYIESAGLKWELPT